MSWVTRTLRLKVKPEAYAWLNEAAREVNAVWNFCKGAAWDMTDPRRGHGGTDGSGQPMRGAHAPAGFDLVYLVKGAGELFDHIGFDTCSAVALEYPRKLAQAKERAFEELRDPKLTPEERTKIRARIRRLKRGQLRRRDAEGTDRKPGWVPFKALSLKHKGTHIRFAGKAFRVFERERLLGADDKPVKWGDGCFAQDACGDWWLCLPVKQEIPAELPSAPHGDVGFDPGVKDILTGSDGWKTGNPRYTQAAAEKLAELQRPRGQQKVTERGRKISRTGRRISRLHRKVARQKKDHAHKVSRRIVNRYQRVALGDVSPEIVRGTNLGMLRSFLQNKCPQAGRSFVVVSEKLTTQACSHCKAITGPKGVSMLSVRAWTCVACGTTHDRDVNSAINIRTRAQVLGWQQPSEPERQRRVRRQRERGVHARSGSGRGAHTRASETGEEPRSGAS